MKSLLNLETKSIFDDPSGAVVNTKGAHYQVQSLNPDGTYLGTFFFNVCGLGVLGCAPRVHFVLVLVIP